MAKSPNLVSKIAEFGEQKWRNCDERKHMWADSL